MMVGLTTKHSNNISFTLWVYPKNCNTRGRVASNWFLPYIIIVNK